MLLITFLHHKHQEVYYCIEQTFHQPCHCQNLEDPKRFPTKPGDLAKNPRISMDGKL